METLVTRRCLHSFHSLDHFAQETNVLTTDLLENAKLKEENNELNMTMMHWSIMHWCLFKPTCAYRDMYAFAYRTKLICSQKNGLFFLSLIKEKARGVAEDKKINK